jgi:mxaJ protein
MCSSSRRFLRSLVARVERSETRDCRTLRAQRVPDCAPLRYAPPGLPGVAVALALIFLALPAAARELRVCADPNNLPFSNAQREGFENRIADLLADELGATVQYTWWAQRRGFIRNTLKAGDCDVVMGMPASAEMARTTAPYYRSTYVFVTRADTPEILSFDDARLRELRVGVQLVGDDGINTPPSHALSRRGIVQNVRGYMVYGDYREPNPSARIVAAVGSGEIDVALVWGPLAGYFATRQATPLRVTPVRPAIDGPTLPMVFDISVGVRRDDERLRAELDTALDKRAAEVDAILAEYGVPRVDRNLRQAGARP